MSVNNMLLARSRLAAGMPPSTSDSNASSTLLTPAERMAYPKSDIQIHLKNHFKSKTYTSGSHITGEVVITTQRDVRFDIFETLLVGMSKTKTDGYAAPHESAHIFLKLAMPIPESTYPVPRVLEAGRTFRIPFNFVIPTFLTLGACNHNVVSDQVRDQHLCLPPSMGSWAVRNWEKDDFAPQMAAIEYSIKARVCRVPNLHTSPVRIVEAVQQIQVLPAYPEYAPLNITKNDRLYTMCKAKTMRKNLITAKMGKLTVFAPQPQAIMIQPDSKVAANTTAQVELKFDPVSVDMSPPKVTSISAKITAHTYYSAGAFHMLPNMSDWSRTFMADRSTDYSTSVSLFQQPLGNISWAQHSVSQARRDSGYSSDDPRHGTTITSENEELDEQLQQQQRRRSSILRSIPKDKQRKTSRSSSRTCSVYHTSTIQVPINLPTAKKTFIPTYHSCISSRVYTLHLSLTVASGNTTSSTISLTLPLQIAVEAVVSQTLSMDGLPSFEAAVEEAAVDEFMQPRLLSVPNAQFLETSALPEYEI